MPRTPPPPVSYLAASEPQSDRAARAAARLSRFESETPSQLGDGYAPSPQERPSPIPEEDEAVVVTEVVPPGTAATGSGGGSSDGKGAQRWDVGFKELGFPNGAALRAAKELELLIAVDEDLKTVHSEGSGQVNACFADKKLGCKNGIEEAWERVRLFMTARDQRPDCVRLWTDGVSTSRTLRQIFFKLMEAQGKTPAPRPRTGVRTESGGDDASPSERRRLLQDLYRKWNEQKKKHDAQELLSTAEKAEFARVQAHRRQMVRAFALGKNLAEDLDAAAASPEDDGDSSPPPPQGAPSASTRLPKRARTTADARLAIFALQERGAKRDEAAEARHKALLEVKERQLGLEEKRLELDDKRIMLDAKRLEEQDKLKDMVIELRAEVKETQREFHRNLARQAEAMETLTTTWVSAAREQQRKDAERDRKAEVTNDKLGAILEAIRGG